MVVSDFWNINRSARKRFQRWLGSTRTRPKTTPALSRMPWLRTEKHDFFCWEILFKDAGRGKVYSGWFSWFIGHWFDECCWWLICFLTCFLLGILTMDIRSLFCLKVDLSACFLYVSFMATLRSSSFWQGHLEVQLRHHITNLRREAGCFYGDR